MVARRLDPPRGMAIDPKELEAASADPAEYEVAAWALGEIRKTKALAKRSLRTDVDLVVVRETPEHLTFLRGCGAGCRRGREGPFVRVRRGHRALGRGELAPED